jgi:hypothetical protein
MIHIRPQPHGVQAGAHGVGPSLSRIAQGVFNVSRDPRRSGCMGQVVVKLGGACHAMRKVEVGVRFEPERKSGGNVATRLPEMLIFFKRL